MKIKPWPVILTIGLASGVLGTFVGRHPCSSGRLLRRTNSDFVLWETNRSPEPPPVPSSLDGRRLCSRTWWAGNATSRSSRGTWCPRAGLVPAN